MSMAEYKGKVKNIQDTPFGYTMSIIGGKWKMVIIYLLAENESIRFNELKRQIGAIMDWFIVKNSPNSRPKLSIV